MRIQQRISGGKRQAALGLALALILPFGYAADENERIIMVEGLALDSMGLKRTSGLEEFTSLTHPLSELPEFSLAAPMFTREPKSTEVETEGYFPVLGRNMLGQETKRIDWFAAYSKAEAAVSISPENMDSLKGAALLAAVMKNYAKADEYLAVYVPNRPDDMVARAAWGHVLMFQKKFSDAASAVDGVLAKQPDNLRARFTLACARYGSEDELDTSYWRQLGAAEKVQVASWLRGDARMLINALGREAITDLSRGLVGRKAAGNLPLIADSLRNGEKAFQRKDYKTAKLYYEAAGRYGVDSVMVLQNLAMCFYELGEVEKAHGQIL